jgi:hypothetical protein
VAHVLRFWAACLLSALSLQGQQVLYNGIRLPAVWPPQDVVLTNEPQPDPPYLLDPPGVIPIDVGRQLFVDDFLIESTDLRRSFHRPEVYPGSPVLRGDKPWEAGHAMPYSDGAFYDPKDRVFKIWYRGAGATLYATSRDGVHWEKPLLDVQPGTNAIQTGPHDSSTVWLDLDEPDASRRYKMGYSLGHNKPFAIFESADGIHWGQAIAQSVRSADRITFFKNPFRNVWVFSLRDHDWAPSNGAAKVLDTPPKEYEDYIGRLRRYWEVPDFAKGAAWKAGDTGPNNPRVAAPAWAMADRLDPRRIDLNVQPQLYNLDAVAYESLMLGAFAIWPGQYADSEKPNYLTIGYSRDGFHWTRPDRRPFIEPTGREGDWNRRNVQSVGGVCLLVGDRIYFYFSARAGVPGSRKSGDTSTGLATLRRDGFASLDADGTARTLTTRVVRFTGSRLFVNVDSTAGEMRVEALDAGGRAISGFTAADCLPLRVDSTLAAVRWRGGSDLASLAGRSVRFRFHLRDARLFSFWVSPDESGSSRGYVAAGGPGFTGSRDTEGTRAYRNCCRPDVW